MASESQPRFSFGLKGFAAFLAAIAAIAIFLIAPRAYRLSFLLFLLISVLIGIVVAGGLTLWHRLRPIKEEDVNRKRPLGL